MGERSRAQPVVYKVSRLRPAGVVSCYELNYELNYVELGVHP
jgi:hypothetical protein